MLVGNWMERGATAEQREQIAHEFLCDIFNPVLDRETPYFATLVSIRRGIKGTNGQSYAATRDGLQQMARDAIRRDDAGEDCYFANGLTARAINKKPKNADIVAICHVWHDGDAGEGQHESGKPYPPTLGDVLKNYPVELGLPSICIRSGGGVHAYYLLDRALECSEEFQRRVVAAFVRDFQDAVLSNARSRGWIFDNTSDLSRILRIPGTRNHKREPFSPVYILSAPMQRVAAEKIESLKPMKNDGASNAKATTKKLPANAGSNEMLEIVRAMLDCIPADIDYDTWVRIGQILHGGGIPFAFWDGWSRRGSKYKDGEPAAKWDTFGKLDGTADAAKMGTLVHIAQQYGYRGLVPAQLEAAANKTAKRQAAADEAARRQEERAAAIKAAGKLLDGITDPTTEIAYREDTLKALAISEAAGGTASLAAFLDRAKQHKGEGKIRLTALQKKISAAAKMQKNTWDVEDADAKKISGDGGWVDFTKFCEVFPGAPPALRVPRTFWIKKAGVYWKKPRTINGMTYLSPEKATSTLIVPARYFDNQDTGTRRVEILILISSKTRRNIVCNPSDVLDARKLLDLADHGLNVSSVTAKTIARFLQDTMSANVWSIPVGTAYGRTGWRNLGATDEGTPFFVLPGRGDYSIDIDDGGSIEKAYVSNGEYNIWNDFAVRMHGHQMARLAIAASISAPLLALVAIREGFALHLWGDSGHGKTAAMVFAASIWGNRERLLHSLNATKVAVERRAAQNCDMPLFLDELQSARSFKWTPEQITQEVYQLAGGISKGRGTLNGIQKEQRWRTVLITSGEEPVTSRASTKGVLNRLIEIRAQDMAIPDALAREAYATTRNHFGHLGQKILKWLEIEKSRTAIAKYFSAIRDILFKADGGQHMPGQITNAAMLCLADAVFQFFCMGKEFDENLLRTCMEWARGILERLPTSLEADDNQAGEEFVFEWILSNREHFDRISAKPSPGTGEPCRLSADLSPVYGWEAGGFWYIYPSHLDGALRKEGFSPRKILSGMCDRGTAIGEQAKHTRRTKARVIDPQTQKQIRVYKIRKDDIDHF